MTATDAAEARRLHFGHFYGILPIDEENEDRPFVVVHGNCQAGSIRRLLETSGATAVRIPPVHELTADDVPRLHALVERADLLVSQPVGSDYHGLPVGSAQLADLLPAGAQTLLVPVLRFAGLFPFQVTVRPSFAPSIDPPGVPYHDLRTLLCAAEFPEESAWTPAMNARFRELTALVEADDVRRLAASSVDAMRQREQKHGTVALSEVLAEDIWTYRTHHTLNHPTNAFFERAVSRILAETDWAAPHAPTGPDFEMLGGIRGRVEPVASEVFPVEAHEWRVGEDEMPETRVRDLQLQWYREQPGFVEAGLARHADTLELLGLPAAARPA